MIKANNKTLYLQGTRLTWQVAKGSYLLHTPRMKLQFIGTGFCLAWSKVDGHNGTTAEIVLQDCMKDVFFQQIVIEYDRTSCSWMLMTPEKANVHGDRSREISIPEGDIQFQEFVLDSNAIESMARVDGLTGRRPTNIRMFHVAFVPALQRCKRTDILVENGKLYPSAYEAPVFFAGQVGRCCLFIKLSLIFVCAFDFNKLGSQIKSNIESASAPDSRKYSAN